MNLKGFKLPSFKGKSFKKPVWLSHFIVSNGDSYSIQLTKKQIKILVAAIVVILIACLALGAWGLARQAEVMQLRDTTQSQSNQLKLLQQKTQMLDKKMQVLDSLDKEIRQMIKGSESGTSPTTEDKQSSDTSSSKEDPSPADGDAPSLTTTQMSIKLSSLDVQAQKRLASFYMLRNILNDGVGKNIKDIQSINFASGTTNSANSTTPSIWPVDGVITSPFGGRIDPVYGGGGNHEGIDIGADYGAQVVATAAGTVTIAAATDGGYGNLVEIDHGNGFVTRYGHNSVLLVSVGMHVAQGQAISLVGSTGKSTGPHLHYEVRVNGSPVDPMVFLPIN